MAVAVAVAVAEAVVGATIALSADVLDTLCPTADVPTVCALVG